MSLENLCVTVPVKQRGPSRKNSDRCEVTREGKIFSTETHSS